MENNKVEALVFDMDGTLAATEDLHMQAWLQVLGELGMDVDHEWFQQWIGSSDAVLAREVLAEHDLASTQEEMQEKKRNLFYAAARSGASLFEGVKEGLATLKEKFPLALATSSSDMDAEAVFFRTGLDTYFSTIVTSDRVERLKPDPYPYLLACRELKKDPSVCIAIEDSPIGVEAAHKAGLYVLGITTSKTPEELGLAHRIFSTTREAMDWIDQLK